MAADFINVKSELLSLKKPIIMGILNDTPDSFYDQGAYHNDEVSLLKHVEKMLQEGAHIIDLGAVSTRPGAKDIDEQIEIERVQKDVKLILRFFPKAILSIDTWRSGVAEVALSEGAALINDISGGTFDTDMFNVIAKYNVPYCLTHCPAKPDVMQNQLQNDHIIASMLQFFGEQIAKLKQKGVNDIIIDPGFGFGKTLEQNYLLLRNLSCFTSLDLPLMVGLSRKSMIYKLLNCSPAEALNGTTALHTMALLNGANIIRVHDVKEARETILLCNQLYSSVK